MYLKHHSLCTTTEARKCAWALQYSVVCYFARVSLCIEHQTEINANINIYALNGFVCVCLHAIRFEWRNTRDVNTNTRAMW